MKVYKVSLYGLFLLLVLGTLLLSASVLAQESGYYTVSQGEKRVQITPVSGETGASDFYGLTNSQSHTGLEQANTAVMFLYRDTTTGEISLFVLLSATGGTAGTTTFALSGVPAGASFVVQDDGVVDFREVWELTPPTAKVTWQWDEAKADGMVLGPLGSDFDINIMPQFTTGITAAKFLTGSVDVPQEVPLNLLEGIVVEGMPNEPPQVSFVTSPAKPHINEPVTFDASSTFDPDGTIVEYEWDFDGDGLFDEVVADPVVSYNYTVAGTKNVTLRATDAEGATERFSMSLYISDLAVSVTRTISTVSAIPGSTFKVVVCIEPEMDLAGVGLEEKLPVGWKIKPIENAGAAFKRAAVQWVFIDKIKAGTTKVISYEVTVPGSSDLVATTLPVCFDIEGIFQARTPSLELPVEGDYTVEITDALPLNTAIAHLVPRIDFASEDSIDLRLSQKISPEQLNRALEMWQNEEYVPWTQGEVINLEDMKEISAYAYTCTPVDVDLPAMEEADINAVRTIATPVPCNNILLNYTDAQGNLIGNTFTVKVEISADQDMYGVGLAEDLPTGWKVIPIENDGFTYKRSQVEWVYPSKIPAGVMKTIIYQVEVPQSEAIETSGSDPCYVSNDKITGVVDSALPCQDTFVTGDSTVIVSDCLPVIVAISRWDVDNDTIDINLSDKISFQQVQRAIAFWLEDELVPRTCGRTVSYETLKTIIAYWLTNTNICDPLPGSVLGPCEGSTGCIPCGD